MPKHPIRIFDGTTRPHEPFWRLRDAAEAESGEPEVEFYGYISEYSWFDDDITPKMFKDDLYKLGTGGPVTVRVNSGGGDMIAASVIRATIMEYPGRVTMRIDGLCASAATYIVMAGDRVCMQDTAYFVIHDPSTMVFGNIEELKKALDVLKTLKSGILDAYQVKTSLDTEKLSRMMTAETWMTAREAKEFGFVDDVISTSKKAKMPASAVLINALSDFVNVPAELARAATPDKTADHAAERFRAEVAFMAKEATR